MRTAFGPRLLWGSIFQSLFFVLSVRRHETSLQSLTAFHFSIRFFTLLISHPFYVFSSIIFTLDLFFSLCYGVCVHFLRVLPLQAASSTNLPSSFCPLPRIMVKQLWGIPHAGDRDGFVLFMIFADLAPRLVWYHRQHFRIGSCSGHTEHVVPFCYRCISCFIVLIQLNLLDSSYLYALITLI